MPLRIPTPNRPIIERCADLLKHSRGRGFARYWSTRPGKYTTRDKLAVLGFVYAYRDAPDGVLTYARAAAETGIEKNALKAMIREWYAYTERPVGTQDVAAVAEWVSNAK